MFDKGITLNELRKIHFDFAQCDGMTEQSPCLPPGREVFRKERTLKQ